MDGFSAGLTAATKAATGNAEGKLQGSALLRAIGMQQAEHDHLAAETNASNARANYYTTRTPTDASDATLRQALVDAGNDENDVDAAIAASRRGDRSGLKSLFTATPRPPAPHIIKSTTGYLGVGADGTASPITGPDGTAVRPPLPTPRAGRTNTAEPPAHRDIRQGLTAVNGQLKDDRAQIQALDRAAPPLVRFPGIATGTAADSANARDFTTRHATIQQHADSLRGVQSQLAHQLTAPASARPAGGAAAPPGGGRTGPSKLPPLAPSDITRAKSDPGYARFLKGKGYNVAVPGEGQP